MMKLIDVLLNKVSILIENTKSTGYYGMVKAMLMIISASIGLGIYFLIVLLTGVELSWFGLLGELF